MKSILSAKAGGAFLSMDKLIMTLCLSLIPLVSFASGSYPTDSFPIPEGAYSAKFVENRDNVTIMDFAGNYNKLLETGQFNRAARAVIANEFYREHPDHYDFIVTFSSFEFETGDAVAFYHGVRNDTQGIGKPLFDNSGIYGSSGKLQGFIDMAATSRYVLDPFNPEFEWPMQVLAHEVLHRWGSFVRFNDSEGNPSEDLIGRDGAHWSFFLDTKASVQYGSQWQPNPDGTFSAVATRKFYSPLDLYLMGFYSAEQVPDFFFIKSTDARFDKASYPIKGAVLAGTKQVVSIEDIISYEGPRVPDAANSQKEFRFAFVYLKQAGEELNQSHIAGINSLRKSFIERFSIMTGGRGIAHVYPEAMPLADLGVDEGVQADTNDHIRVDAADTQDALTWLRSKRDPSNSFWEDKVTTRLRDTTAVFLTLSDLDREFGHAATVETWLSEQETVNTDSLARRLLVLKIDTASADKLAALQTADGGWGLSSNYSSNPLDTALAVQALATSGLAPESVSRGTHYLLQAQNPDGGWPESSAGASAERATAAVINALAVASVEASTVAAMEHALAWLTGRQHSSGGFGGGAGTVNETAEVILAVLASRMGYAFDMGAALQFISERQRTSGSWEGSVYTTAMAAKALQTSSLPNLSIQSFSVNKSSAFDGERITFSLTIKNDSPLLTPSAVVQLFKGNPSAGGVPILSPITLPQLTPNSSIVVNPVWDTLDQVGEHQIYAAIDPELIFQERSRSDNTASLIVEVEEAPSGVDLEFNATEFLVTPEHPINLPTELAVSATLRNLGQTSAENIIVQLWQGQPNPGAGILMGEEMISLPARTSGATNFVVNLSSPGSTRYTVIADPGNQVTEINKDNNSATKIVNTASALDVEIRSDDIVVRNLPAILHEDVEIQVTIRNPGTLPSADFRVNYLIQNIEGTKVIATNQLALEAGKERTLDIVWRADFFGASNFIVEVDPDNLLVEANEENNSATISINTQQLEGANLALTSHDLLFTPDPALEGMGVTLAAGITNTGTLPLTSVPVAFYDGDPSSGGVQLARVIVADIAAGERRLVETIWPEVSSAAERLIFIQIDPDNQIDEFNEADNLAFKKLTVRALPDLAVSEAAITISPQFPKLGDAATINVSVSNLGNQQAINVPVKAYHGNPDAGGVEIGSGAVIAAINGSGVGSASFSFTVTRAGTDAIFVVVDPDGVIQEKTRSNNSASKQFAVQDGNFYVSERYISPDSNGIKDSTDFFFRLENSETVAVVITDHRGKELRSFTQAFDDVTAGNVRWDGLTDAGSMVLDGRYQFVVKNTQGISLGGASVDVDTNRASLAEALDTQFQLDRNLTCTIGNVVDYDAYYMTNNRTIGDKSILYSPDNEYIYFLTSYTPREVDGVLVETDQYTLYPSGIYRANRNGTEVTSIDIANDFPIELIEKMYISDDGERLVGINRSTNSEGRDFSVWTVDATNGSGLRIALDNVTEVTQHTLFKSAEMISGKKEILTVSHDNDSYSIDVVDISVAGGLNKRNLAILPSGAFESVNSQAVHLIPNPSSSHMLIQMVESLWFDNYADVFTKENANLYLLNPDTGTYKFLGHKAHSVAWSPNGKTFAVGDPTKGGVVLYDVNGNELQVIRLPRPYQLPERYEYLLSAMPADFRHTNAILGRFAGIDWNPDGTELAFVYEDYAQGFITQNLWVEAGFNAYGYGGGTIAALNLAQFQMPNSKGVYVADLKTNSIEKHADIATIPSFEGPVEDSSYLNDLEEDAFGNLISPEGLPIIPWTGSYHWNGSEGGRRIVEWMVGARAVMISGQVSAPSQWGGNSKVNRAYIVGFDSETATRQLFPTRNIGRHLLPTSSGKHLYFFSTDQEDKCPANDEYRGHRQVESLLNLTADLRVIRSSRSGGILLEGTAADKNLDSYLLEFARVDSPENWQVVMPPSVTGVIDDQFTTWVPPDKGSYLVRLTVNDRAGNSKQVVKRASLSERPSLTNIYRQPGYFSPNSDGVQDVVTLHFKVLEPVNLEVSIFNESGTLVRKIEQSYTEVGSDNEIIWDGRNGNGQRVADGTYTLLVQNYEFFVDVDTDFPVIAHQPKGLLYPKSRDSDNVCKPNPTNNVCLIGIDTKFGFEARDANSIPTVFVEYKGNQATQWSTLELPIKEYLNVIKFPLEPREPTVTRTLSEWVNGFFRVIAEDRAGNRSVLQIPSQPKRDKVYITRAHYVEEFEQDKRFGTSLDVPFELPGDPPGSYSLTADNTGSIIFEVVESFPGAITNVEVLFQEVNSTEPLISAPVSYFGRAGDCASIGCFITLGESIGHRTEDNFAIAWNYSALSLKPGILYRAYLRLTDAEYNTHLSNSILFGSSHQSKVELMRVKPGCFDSSIGDCANNGSIPAVVAITNRDWNTVASLSLFISSTDDKRYAQETLIERTIIDPLRTFSAGGYNHFVFSSADLLACNEYNIKVFFTDRSGNEFITKTSIAAPCMKIEASAIPALPQTCDDPATNRVVFRMKVLSAKTGNQEPVQLQLLTLSREILGEEDRDIVFNVNSPSFGTDYIHQLITTDYEEGEIDFEIAIKDADGNVTTGILTVPIVHDAPSVEITYPFAGNKYCAKPYPHEDGPLFGLDIQGVSQSFGPHSYDMYTRYSEADNWKLGYCQPSALGVYTPDQIQPRGCDTKKIGQSAELVTNSTMGTSRVKGTLGVVPLDKSGQAEVRFESFNWSGSRYCSTVSFEIDAEIEGLSVVPLPGAQGKLGKSVKIYTPTANGLFNRLGWTYTVEESVTVSIDLVALRFLRMDKDTPVFREEHSVGTAATNLAILPGTRELLWDEANTVSDGFYRAKILTRDACGIEATRSFDFEIDTTPPNIMMSYPSSGIGLGMIVEPIGSVTDLNNASYALSISQDGESYIPLSTASGLGNWTDHILGRWNTYGLLGTWHLKVTAIDLVGNASILEREVTLPERLQLISMLELDNNFVSPNSDGNLDTASAKVRFEQDVRADITVLQNEQFIDVIAQDQLYLVGDHHFAWDAKQADGTPFEEGDYQIQVSARLAQGVGTIQTEAITVTLDITPPVINLTNTVDGLLGLQKINPTTNVLGSIVDPHFSDYGISFTETPQGSLSYLLDGGSVAPVAIISSIDAEQFSGEGYYTLQVSAKDFAGNAASHSFQLLIDTTPPAVEITTPASGAIFKLDDGVVDVTGLVEDDNFVQYTLLLESIADSGVDVYRQEYSIRPSSNLGVISLSGVADGNYLLSVVATDKVDWETTKSVPITVDNTLPTAEIALPNGNEFITGPSLIRGTANDENYVQHELAFASAESTAYSSLLLSSTPVTTNTIFNWLSLPEDGAYTLRLTVKDAAGNEHDASKTIIVDTQPPSAPNLESVTFDKNINAVALGWTAVTDSDLAGYHIYRSGTRLTALPITSTSFIDEGITEGSYLYKVVAVDRAGWESVPAEKELVVDITPPRVSLLRPTNGSVLNGVISIVGTATSVDDFKEYRLEIGRDANSLVSLAHSSLPLTGGVLGQWDATNAQEGVTYLVRLVAEDIHGNVATSEATVSIDNTPPSAPLNLVATVTNGNHVQMSWTPSTESDIHGYLLFRNDRLVNAPSVLVGDLTPYVISASTYLDQDVVDGSHTFVVLAVDQAGNISDPSQPISVTIDVRAPHAEFLYPSAMQTFEDSVYMAVEVLDEDVAEVEFEYRLLGAENWISIDVDRIAPFDALLDISSLDVADYQLRATAKDFAANIDLTPDTLTILKRDITAPAVLDSPNVVVVGGEVSVAWQASDAEDLAGYALWRRPGANHTWQRLNPELLSALQYTDLDVLDGTYEYSVNAVDLTGNEADRSASSPAIVFTPQVAEQFTPSVAQSVTIEGVTLAFASVTLRSYNAEGQLAVERTVNADAEGVFVFDALQLQATDNRFDVTATTQQQFISKSVGFEIYRAAAPAQVTGVLASLHSDGVGVDLSWNANTEEDLLGYRIYRDGESITPLVNLTTITPLTLPPELATSGIENIADLDETNEWYWSPSLAQVQLQLSEPSLVSEIELLWFSASYSLKKYRIMVWTGERWLTAATLDYSDTPQAQQRIQLAQPYVTDRVLIVATNTHYNLYLKEVFVRAFDLANDADYFSDLPPDGVRSYRVSAFNDSGIEGLPSDPTEIAFGDMTAPDTVSLSGEVIGSDIHLVWSASASDDVAEYRVYRDEVLVAIQESSTLTYTDTSVSNGVYVYQIRPVDSVGNTGDLSNSFEAIVDVPVLPAPVNLVLEVDGNIGHLILSWDLAPASNVPVGYSLYRSSSSTDGFVLVADIAEKTYRDTDVDIGTTYRYHVRAYDALNNKSAPSNEVSGVPDDVLVPEKPEIFRPTVSGLPFVSPTDKVDVAGLAEPGSRVSLIRNNTVIASQRLRLEFPELTLAGYSIINVSESPVGQLAVAIETHEGKREVYIVEDDEIRFLINTWTLNFDIREVTWAGDMLIMSSDNSELAALDTISGEIEIFRDLFSSWGDVYKLISFDATSKELIFAGNNNGTRGLHSYALDTGKLSLINSTNLSSYSNSSVSPDGEFIGFVENYSSTQRRVRLFNLKSYEEHMHFVPGGNSVEQRTAVSWSADSEKILVTTTNPAGRQQVILYNVLTQESSVVASSENEHFAQPVWSFDGKSIVYEVYGQGNTKVVVQNYASGETDVLFSTLSESRLSHLHWSDNNTILFGQLAAGVKAKRFAGHFNFADINILQGDNELSTFATDNAGNESEVSDSILVYREQVLRPDLAVSGVIQSSLLKINSIATASITVRNNGTAVAPASVVNVISRNAEGEVSQIASEKAIKALEVGEATSFDIEWLITAAGQHSVIAVVDPDSTISESTRSNNVWTSDLQVVELSQPFLQLDIQSSIRGGLVFAAHDAMVGTLSITNAGNSFTGSVLIRVEDEDGYLVETLAEHSISALAYGATVTHPVTWNTGTTFAGNYKITAALMDAQQVLIDRKELNLVIMDDIRLTAGVTTNFALYSANTDVALRATLANNGGNSLFEGGEILVSITHRETGEQHALFRQAIGEILPGDQSVSTFTWNTGLEQPGNYQITYRVWNNSAQEILVALAEFEVISGAPQILGQLGDVSTQIGINESLSIPYTITNVGNAAIENVDVLIELTHPESGEVVRSNTRSLSIGYQQSSLLIVEQETMGLALGTYHINLIHQTGSSTGTQAQQLDRVSVTITDTIAPRLSYISPEAGAVVSGLRGGIIIEAVDEETSVASVQVTLAGDVIRTAFRDLENANAYRVDLRDLAEGAHSIESAAVDLAGNTSNTEVLNITIDNTPPQISVSGVVDGDLYTTNVAPIISVVEPHLLRTTIELNGEVYVSGTMLTNDGSYRLVVTSEDVAGNLSRVVTLFEISKVEAAIAIEGVSHDGAYNSPVIPVVQASGIHHASLVITLNNEPFVSGTSVSAEGNYILRVVAEDLMGNTLERYVEFDLDFTSPVQPQFINPVGGASVSDAIIEVRGIAEPDAYVTLTVNDGELQTTVADAEGTFVFGNISLQVGSNSLVATARDRAGNYSDASAINVTHSVASNVIIDPDFDKRSRVLMWIPEKNTGHFYDDVDALVELLSSAYDDANTTYFVATNPSAFLVALRSQQYNVINLVNLDTAPLLNQGDVFEELQAAVLSGSGLVVFNTKPGSLSMMRDMLGAKTGGRLANSSKVTFNDEILDGIYNWDTTQFALKVYLKGGTPIGSVHYDCGHHVCTQPALVSHTYGKGRTILAPFDLTAIENTAELKLLISSITSYVSPSEYLVLPSALTNLSWFIDGLNEDTGLVVHQDIASELKYYAVYGGSHEDASAVWSLVNQGDSAYISASILTPAIEGSYPIESSIYSGLVSSATLLSENTYTLNSQYSLPGLKSNLISSIEGLSVPNSKRKYRDSALSNARLAVDISLDTRDQAQAGLIYLSNSLAALTHLGNEALLIQTAELIKIYQSVWTVKPDIDENYGPCNQIDPNAVNYPAWNATTIYTIGEYVNYKNLVWKAKWWNIGAGPESADAPWWLISDVEYPWHPLRVYEIGDELNHNGRRWRAQWWVTRDEPGSHPAWVDIGVSTCPGM